MHSYSTHWKSKGALGTNRLNYFAQSFSEMFDKVLNTTLLYIVQPWNLNFAFPKFNFTEKYLQR